MEVSIQQVKDYLREQLRAGAWRQEEAVVRTSDFKQGYDIVFYDAYSAKTNSDLWSEDFLDDFFKNKLNTRFVFSTYACTAVLKQVAKNNQCFFEKRDGFMGKRNSSMIYR